MEVRFDEYTRQLYTTYASAYEVTSIGVVFPNDTNDVAAVMEYCAEREIPVLLRDGARSSNGDAVVAPDASYRVQLGDWVAL